MCPSVIAGARRALAGALVSLAFAACGTGEVIGAGTSGTPNGLSISGGNNQSVAAGLAATTPLSVKVVNQDGTPLAGVAVAWSVTSGGGSVSPTTSTTDASGIASASFTAGASEGTTVVSAAVTGLTTVNFTITVTAPTIP